MIEKEGERGAMEELAGSWLSLINSVSAILDDCSGQRRTVEEKGDPLMMEPVQE